jgi:MYXO-CTERM domain-containing protein
MKRTMAHICLHRLFLASSLVVLSSLPVAAQDSTADRPTTTGRGIETRTMDWGWLGLLGLVGLFGLAGRSRTDTSRYNADTGARNVAHA